MSQTSEYKGIKDKFIEVYRKKFPDLDPNHDDFYEELYSMYLKGFNDGYDLAEEHWEYKTPTEEP